MKNIFIPFIAGLLGILVGAITVYNIISSDYQSIEVVTKPTATPNQKEVVKANDTRCDLPGVCSQLCIGEDCRNEWPKAGDTRCDEPGKCSQVCIGEDCRYVWPEDNDCFVVEGKAEIFLEKNEENEVPVKVECPQEYVIRRACLACVNHKGYSFTGAYVYALWHCDLPLGDNVYSYSFGSCDTDPDITYKSSYEDKTPIKCKYDEGCTVVKYVRALYCKS